MKTTLGILTLASLMATSAFASDCSKEAKEIAKMNLDQVARINGFKSSDIIGSPTLLKTKDVEVTEDMIEKVSTFTVDGYIYKASYTVTVTLGGFCDVRNVTVHDDSLK